MAVHIKYETLSGNTRVIGYIEGATAPIPPVGADFDYVTEPIDFELCVADINANGVYYVNERERWRWDSPTNTVIQRNDTSKRVNVEIINKQVKVGNTTTINFEYRDSDDVLDATFNGKRFIALTNLNAGTTEILRMNFTAGLTSRVTTYASGEHVFSSYVDKDDGPNKNYRLQGEIEFLAFEEVEA